LPTSFTNTIPKSSHRREGLLNIKNFVDLGHPLDELPVFGISANGIDKPR
jgi:hypothetical protein